MSTHSERAAAEAAEDDADGAAIRAVRFDPDEEFRPAEEVFAELGLARPCPCVVNGVPAVSAGLCADCAEVSS